MMGDKPVTVIPDAAKRRSGIQTQVPNLLLDSGFAPSARPGMTAYIKAME
jgi:hypothetical protein